MEVLGRLGLDLSLVEYLQRGYPCDDLARGGSDNEGSARAA